MKQVLFLIVQLKERKDAQTDGHRNGETVTLNLLIERLIDTFKNIHTLHIHMFKFNQLQDFVKLKF